MYVYDCNTNLTTPSKNKSYKDIINDLTELKTQFKSRGINPGLHIMENEGSNVIKRPSFSWPF